MKITKIDQTKTVEFKDLKGGDFFHLEEDSDLMIKLVYQMSDDGRLVNCFSINQRMFYEASDNTLCIPIEIEEIIYKEAV